MKHLYLLLVLLNCCLAQSEVKSSSYFRFHLMGEPYQVDPMHIRGSAGSYLFSNIYRGLYRYNTNKGLIYEGAKSCRWLKKTIFECQLDPSFKWTDGEPVTADHYVQAWRRIVDPNSKSVQTELLMNIKNVRKILSGKLSPDSLGARALSQFHLQVEFEKFDADFPYKLTYPTLAPIRQVKFPDRDRASEILSTGPYKISQWHKGKKIILIPNKFYKNRQISKVEVEVLFIDDDETALRLFETGRLNFLRRLNTFHIPKYSKSPGFFQVPVARFDYVGFGPELNKYKNLRKAMSLALDYKALKNLLHALGRPGCPSLPSSFMDTIPCYAFDIKAAQKAFASLPESIRKKRWPLYFSQMGGEDIARAMEWMQNQWKVHLGLNVELRSMEQGMYLSQLRSHPPALFRKGVGVDRPTCLAALEVFTPDNPENFIRLNSSKYNKLVHQITHTHSEIKKKKVCSSAIKVLLDEFYLIPLGEIHFTMLEDQKFTGWNVNEINQLDLTDISLSKK